MPNYKKALSMICALSVLCSNSTGVVSALSETEPTEAHAGVEHAPKAPASSAAPENSGQPAASDAQTAEASKADASDIDAAVEVPEAGSPEAEAEAASEAETVEAGEAAPESEAHGEAPIETQTPAPQDEAQPAETAEPGATAEPSVTPEPDATAEPGASAEPGENPAQDEGGVPTDAPAATEPLNVVAIALKRSGFVGWEIEVVAPITGGVEPYTVHYSIDCNGAVVYTADEPTEVVRYYPFAMGIHTLTVTVTDAEGSVATARVGMHVAVREQENPRVWTRTLTKFEEGMNYAERLLAVAESQVGYKESDRDFIVDKNGNIQGYSRYGDWWGLEYEEWCAMFVSFCLSYAEIPWEAIPEESNCERWRRALGDRYINIIEDEENADYEPQPGDLIFFRTDDTVVEKDFPTHIGIVTGTSENYIYTIEGNSAASVREREYKRDNERIVGYASIVEAMEKYDENYNPVENAVAFEIDAGAVVTSREA